MQKNLYMVSLGCPKNLVDSEVMLALLEQDGYRVCEDPDQADLLLVNTCGFIQSAVEEGLDEIMALGPYKDKKPGVKLVVAGCLVQRYGQELLAELPEVDLFIGVDQFPRVATLVREIKPSKKKIIITPPSFIMDSSLARTISTPAHRAYLKISEGCSNRCSYCLIPAIRGPLRSRAMDDIVAEAGLLAEAGVRELTLVGQDVTAYGIDLTGKKANLPALLGKLLAGCRADWLRLLYLYPNRISDELLTLMAAEKRLLSYLDIPLQHISDRVLKAMNRPFGRRQVHELLERIRRMVPDAAIRTTFIVGFPGETDEDVEEIAEFLKTYRLNNVGIFTYSNEEGCAAEHFAGQCSDEVKEARYQYLMELQAEISLEKNKEYVGGTIPVLVEGLSRETDLLLEGRSEFQAPEIDGCVYIADGQCAAGDIVMVTVTEAHPYDLVGEIAGPAQKT
ncbi:MAG: 30S ribosomal protein S12 methylthiotransferase RimO [Deltaproteobacteria bacterium]|nr:30S ribosomal protein S12 methylthiotransferase RimO [Deltaproteobacteria bacterium]